MATALDISAPFEEALPGALEARLAAADLPALADTVAGVLAAERVTIGGALLHVDPVPRVLEAAEWARLATALCQRARALDRFLADIYGRQCIVRDGVIPAAAVASAAHFEPLMQQAAHDDRHFVSVASVDIVRCPDGAFRVVEDEVRTPWGLTYALAAREAVQAAVPPPPGLEPMPLEPAFSFLARALRAAAPAGVEEPVVALLTDGPGNLAYCDHQRLADLLGLELVQLADLRLRGGRLFAHVDGRDIHIDVVYRRTDEERLLSPRGGLTDVGTLLLEPWVHGTLGLVNAFGTGVADDRLLHAYVEQMVRFYLGEEPLLESVRTWDLLAPGALNRAVERLDTLVLKRRNGAQILIGPEAGRAELDRAADALRAAPSEYVVQDFVPRSVHPTVAGGALVREPCDLRPFVFSTADAAVAVPGGITRLDGRIQDTWVV